MINVNSNHLYNYSKLPLIVQALNVKQRTDKLTVVDFSPWKPETERALAEIVVHFTLVVGALSHDQLLTPFVTILTQTAKSKVSCITTSKLK